MQNDRLLHPAGFSDILEECSINWHGKAVMSSKVPIIAFVSPKGGTGKTTATLALASDLLHRFQDRITIIEADPNNPLQCWQTLGKKPELLEVISDKSEETILDNIESAKQNSKFVLIDLEGSKNMRATYAVSRADLVIVPMQASMLDANEAAEAVKLIKRTEQVFGRMINYSILFTRLSAAIISRNYVHISKQLSESKIQVFDAQLSEREAFKTMFSTGRCLYDLNKAHVTGLDKAKLEVNRLGQTVLEKLNHA